MTTPKFWELAHVSDHELRHGLLDPSELPQAASPEPARALRSATIEPVAEAVYKIQFEASRQLKEQIDLARALSSHENPTGKLEVSWDRPWRFGWTKYRSGVLRKRTSRAALERRVSDCGSRQ